MPRYIDADALIGKMRDFSRISEWQTGGLDFDYKFLKFVVESAPTADVVEVVYCEDCKYCDIGENEVDAWCDCRLFKIGCDPLFFCERGERRNDG